MKIRPRISKFLQGGVPQWYLDLYKQHSLGNWNNTLRYDYADLNLNANDHYNAGNLETVYRKQNAYTQTPEVVKLDIQSFYNTDGGNMTAEEFVNFYNLNAEKIRNHWASDLIYNASTAGDHNRLYRKMFLNRSNTSLSPGSEYNIGYQEGTTKGGYDIQDIEGSSTWLRRMDRYEKEFDPNNPDLNRIHEITLKDGSKAMVYKKANGDIGLLSSSPANPANPNLPLDPNQPVDPNNPQGKVPAQHGKYGIDLGKLLQGLQQALPELLGIGRLAGTLAFNDKIYKTKLKGIRPNLQQTYLTHRQVVGDEATKQAYYKRAAAGLTKANRSMTSDKDKYMAYMNEAKRVGDELRERGDLADNAEIKRTSDESNQHQWANTQRRTEVANRNIIELNNANAAKLDLRALKYAADWTSINNYLLGKEHDLKQKDAEARAILDLIWALDEQLKMQEDPEYLKLYEAFSKAYDNAKGNINDPKVQAAKKLLRAKQYRMKRALLESMMARRNSRLWFGKEGFKISRKRKDDLLYKTARDAVDHFRKMSKMSNDSTLRSRTSPIKLSPHPGAPRRMQQGGVAPFLIFTPVSLGGETTISSQGSDLAGTKSSAKGTKEKSTFDVIKDLFKDVQGLPSDVNGLFSALTSFLAKEQAFGNELDPEDLQIMFLQQMNQLNNIKFSKAAYDKAKEQATNNDALNEFAVDNAGRVAALDKDGKITFVSWDKIKEGNLNPLTNNDILNLRAYDSTLSFNDGLFNVVNNGIGVSKIADFIKAHMPSMGSSEETLEGFTKHETNQIRKGFELLKEAPEGYYLFKQHTKELNELAKLALNYIASILPRNMKTILGIHADMANTTVLNILVSLVSSGVTSEHSLEFTPLTGKAANKDGKGSGDSGDMTPAMAFFMGMGDRNEFMILDKTQAALKIRTNSMSLLDAEGHNLGPSTLMGVKQGMYGSQLDVNSATMGDVKISPNGLNQVLIGDGTIYSTELPVDLQALLSGIVKPDLSFLKKIEKADLQLRGMGIKDRDNLTPDLIDTINKVYKQNGLPIIYTQDGSGKPTLTSSYRRFAMLNGYATEDAFEGDMAFNDGAIEVEGQERDQFESMMRTVSGDKKYSLGNGFLGFGGTDVYKGVIYIPMSSSTITALGGTGYKGSAQEYMQIDALLQQRDNALRLGYKNPGNASKLNE